MAVTDHCENRNQPCDDSKTSRLQLEDRAAAATHRGGLIRLWAGCGHSSIVAPVLQWARCWASIGSNRGETKINKC